MKQSTFALFWVILTLVALSGCSSRPSEGVTLTLYNWEEYYDLSVLEDFEKKTGIHVQLEEYGQADDMISAVESNPSLYDVIITDGPSILALVNGRLVQPLDFTKLPNFKHIKEELKSPYFDQGNVHSIPYLYGTTGLGINTQFVTEPVNSWNVLYDQKYKGKIALLDDPREFMTAVLKSQGYSINTVDPAQLQASEERIRLLKGNEVILSDYYPLEGKLANGELWVVMAYSGDLLKATQDHPYISYLIPDEGSNKWVDSYVISSQSKNVEAAHTLLNFIMRPEIAARISNSQFYASPNKDAESLMDHDILSNPVIYPSPDAMANLEYLEGIGNAENEYNRLHTLMG